MNKYAMTMTACSRPTYLKQVLDSLAKNPGTQNYTLHFGIEPVNSEVAKVCQSVTFMPTSVTINKNRLGVLRNPFELLKRTFESGVEGVLYLEDDVILSQDAVNMATWYFAQESKNDYLCMNLYNHDSSSDADPSAMFPGDKFSALGMAITKEQWKSHFEPNWTNDRRGWDFSITALIGSGKKVLQPRVSRSHHIGRQGGTHYYAPMHDKLYIHNPMWGGCLDSFKIEE